MTEKLNIKHFSSFSDNARHEDKIDFYIEHEYYGFYSLDSWQRDDGIYRFQGIVYWKESGRVRDFEFPIDLLKKAKSYKIDLAIKNEQAYIVWTVWFEKGVGKRKPDFLFNPKRLEERLAEEIKIKGPVCSCGGGENNGHDWNCPWQEDSTE